MSAGRTRDFGRVAAPGDTRARPALAYTCENTSALHRAADADRWARVGKHPLRIVLTEGAHGFGQVTLSCLFGAEPSMDRIVQAMALNGYARIADLEGVTLRVLFDGTGARLDQRRKILDRLCNRIPSLIVSL